MQKKQIIFVLSLVLSILVPFYLSLFVFFILFLSKRFPDAKLIYLVFFYGLFYQLVFFQSTLPKENQFVDIVGVVQKIVKQGGFYQSMLLKIRRWEGKYFRGLVKVTDYNKSDYHKVGDLIFAQVKLKRINNYLNQGSPDFRQYMLSKGIIGKGYIKKSHLISALTPSFIEYCRQHIILTLRAAIPDKSLLGLVQALTVGFRENISKKEWRLFQQTGTTHLIAISGLHVGLVAGFFYFIFSIVWKRFASLCEYMAAQRVGAFMAVLGAFFYAFLAGFSLPTQRALIMVASFMMGRCCQRFTVSTHSYLLSLMVVLLLNPFAIYMPGFYLSFFVVFIILNFISNLPFCWVRLQFIITVMLFPLTLYFFSFASIASLPANLLAIPLVSFFILPLCLLVLVFSFSWSQGLYWALWILAKLKLYFFLFLTCLANINILHIHLSIYFIWQVLILTLGCWIFFKMRGLRRLLGILVCLPFFIFPIKKRLPFSEAKLTVLDVGQGLAVVVKTREHLLLYDTGARFPTGFNMGEAVILPYLQYHGFSKIDKMVISHTDIDHRGGADSLLKSIPINDTINNDPGSSKNCHKVSSWVWDGVTFSFLALPYLPGKDNDNSCVLKITNQVNSIILLGDIEKKSEDELMKRYGGKLKSTVMLVPHHGSKSSSGYDFIKAIAPNYAIVSTGRFNRYHFPHDRVLKRYQAAQIPLFNTAYCGQVDWLMTTTKKEFFSVPRCYSGISP